MKYTVSIIVSAFNEAEGISSFANSLLKELKNDQSRQYEIVWVNDGSVDTTQKEIDSIVRLNAASNIDHKPIEFVRNFGHEAAMIAGVDYATGSAIICLDADGQHPPALIPLMLHEFEKGNHVVLMKREHRDDNTWLKKKVSSMFYLFINRISSIKFVENSSDFFLISTEVASHLRNSHRDQTRFLRGFVQSLGYQTSWLSFTAPAREFGQSHYSFGKLFSLAMDAVFGFSFKPLRLSVYISLCFIFITIALAGYSLYQYAFGNRPPDGYTTIIIFLSFSFAVLFAVISVLSMYFEKLIREVRQRPLYIVKNKP